MTQSINQQRWLAAIHSCKWLFLTVYTHIRLLSRTLFQAHYFCILQMVYPFESCWIHWPKCYLLGVCWLFLRILQAIGDYCIRCAYSTRSIQTTSNSNGGGVNHHLIFVSTFLPIFYWLIGIPKPVYGKPTILVLDLLSLRYTVALSPFVRV